MSNVRFAVITGAHNGDPFTCGAEFCFSPPICTRAAPKIENLFLHKGLEKCERLAKQMGFRFHLLPDAKDGHKHPFAD